MNYYTPEIEEFHLGFEYEWKELEDTEWKKEKSPIKISADGYEEQKYGVRVKYLDKEDIKSLEFKTDMERGLSIDAVVGYKLHYILEYNTTSKKLIIKIKNMLRDGSGNYVGYVNYFNGYIKNKSELKKILKQIGI